MYSPSFSPVARCISRFSPHAACFLVTDFLNFLLILSSTGRAFPLFFLFKSASCSFFPAQSDPPHFLNRMSFFFSPFFLLADRRRAPNSSDRFESLHLSAFSLFFVHLKGRPRAFSSCEGFLQSTLLVVSGFLDSSQVQHGSTITLPKVTGRSSLLSLEIS